MPDFQLIQWIISHSTEIVTGLIGILSALGTFYIKWRNVNVAEMTSKNDYVAKSVANLMKHIEIQGGQIERQLKMIADQSDQIAKQSEQIAKLTDELALARTEIRNLREQNDELLKQIHELEELLRKKKD